MDKPEFVINPATGKKLKNWCSEGVSLEKVKKEISKSGAIQKGKPSNRAQPRNIDVVIEGIDNQPAFERRIKLGILQDKG